jgi:hypothetical protein
MSGIDTGMGKVRIRLCFSGHEETVVGTMVGFDNYFSGFSATQGFGLQDWFYENGQPPWCKPLEKHNTMLFIKWESVFVIEALEKKIKMKELVRYQTL